MSDGDVDGASDTEPDGGAFPGQGFRSPRVDGLNALPATDRRVAIRRLAGAGREMIEMMSATAATSEQLNEAAESLERVVAMLRGYTDGNDYVGIAELANAGDLLALQRRLAEAGDPEAFAQFDFSPFIGLANPMSPPMHMDYADNRVRAEVTFGSAFEGPPSCVHGGYVAAVFDEVLGAGQSLSGEQGMTARLTIDYRTPTPLHEPLVVEAWLDHRDGRKIFVKGSMHAGDRLTAEADGLFIAFDTEKFRSLLLAREQMNQRRRERRG
ncbi:MAG: PaaI family thioesterase [Microthrixaceae bacterium]